MLLYDPREFAPGAMSDLYCRYCTDAKGNLLPFEKVLADDVLYYQTTLGVTENAALKMAISVISRQPAWLHLNGAPPPSQ